MNYATMILCHLWLTPLFFDKTQIMCQADTWCHDTMTWHQKKQFHKIDPPSLIIYSWWDRRCSQSSGSKMEVCWITKKGIAKYYVFLVYYQKAKHMTDWLLVHIYNIYIFIVDELDSGSLDGESLESWYVCSAITVRTWVRSSRGMLYLSFFFFQITIRRRNNRDYS